MQIVWKLGYMAMDKAAFEAEVLRADEMYPSFVANCTKLTIQYSARLKRSHGYCSFLFRKPGEYVVSLSMSTREIHGIDRMINTLRHEFAHAIEHILYGKMSHSDKFKDICLRLGGSMMPKMAKGKYAPCAEAYNVSDNVEHEYFKRYSEQLKVAYGLFDIKKPKAKRTPKRIYTYTCECGKYHTERNRKFSDKMLFRKTTCCGTTVGSMKFTVNVNEEGKSCRAVIQPISS